MELMVTMTATESKRGTYTSLNEAPTTQAAATINAIKDYILQAHLKPGDPLPTEARLCADLGVSRSSVRHQTARVADNFVDFLALARRNAQQIQVQQ